MTRCHVSRAGGCPNLHFAEIDNYWDRAERTRKSCAATAASSRDPRDFPRVLLFVAGLVPIPINRSGAEIGAALTTIQEKKVKVRAVPVAVQKIKWGIVAGPIPS